MKKNYLFLGLLMLTIGMSSCNSDNEDEIVEKELSNEQTAFRSDVFSIGYSLRNESGSRTTTFKEGENIIFDVTYYNTTDHQLQLGEEREILLGAASVYRSNGEFVGNPTAKLGSTTEYNTITIQPHGYYPWFCPWFYDAKNPLDTLSKGNYYSMLKATVEYRIADSSNHGGGTKDHKNIELKIPFTVE